MTIKGIHHVSMACDNMEEFRKVKDFYIGLLGLPVCREWPTGVMIDAGNALIEVFNNEKGERAKGSIGHFALLTDDVDAAAARVKAAGYDVFIEPDDRVIRSVPPYPLRMAFCHGPLGEEVEFFSER